MARKPNYDFERREREKAKAEKKQARDKLKAERKNTPQDQEPAEPKAPAQEG